MHTARREKRDDNLRYAHGNTGQPVVVARFSSEPRFESGDLFATGPRKFEPLMFSISAGPNSRFPSNRTNARGRPGLTNDVSPPSPMIRRGLQNRTGESVGRGMKRKDVGRRLPVEHWEQER